ncbi:MAG: hypothetical protein ACI8S3_001086, partial [Alphaproteobacteria bacterium]
AMRTSMTTNMTANGSKKKTKKIWVVKKFKTSAIVI